MLIRLQLARKLDMNWWYFFQCPAFNAAVGKGGDQAASEHHTGVVLGTG
jgi:hypothetical protein